MKKELLSIENYPELFHLVETLRLNISADYPDETIPDLYVTPAYEGLKANWPAGYHSPEDVGWLGR